MISQFFILNVKGDTLFYKDYRGDIPRITSDDYWHEMQSTKGKCGPIFNIDGVNFVSLFVNDLYFVAATIFNGSPTYLLELLSAISRNISDFCGYTSELTVREHYSLILELVEEVLNFGHAQTTSTDDIKPFVKSDSSDKSSKSSVVETLSKLRSFLPPSLLYADDTTSSETAQKSITDESNANNVFLDLLETIHVTIGKAREVITSQVTGCVNIKSFCKGIIATKLSFLQHILMADTTQAAHALPHSVILDDASFHSIVDADAFEKDKSLRISSLPIGETQLMQYRISKKVTLPLSLVVSYNEINPHRVELLLKLITDVPADTMCTKICVKVKVPPSVSGVNFVSQSEESSKRKEMTEYSLGDHEVVWMTDPMEKDEERGMLLRISTDDTITPLFRKQMGPAKLFFEVPNYTPSSLSLQFESISDGSRSFNPTRWIRRLTFSGSCVFRF
ncbi:Adaptor protein complex 4 (AP-4), mu subunitA [Monocercomonoides exilis]|uniref:Adaptor protein complex 4 (AP-4), mu subunitA n=1 Tax=Monocercomonoides exilis TaxID=2049356 RepID=UPI003559CAF2|nr:Adaptor protein complex 4 (AP-4), mu subunitA [Monocercomonoides exilis]|eukprot:MONOS_1606.1-p1 / transcript=MONOS_1606.1 / gene=MONOS_1606 / organism=Monocercomonoides_exilis_PA203 / gene_product= Adaptor protein complex 4 (AP-4), mu subunit A / transcript_product= Adaptor protein complex 4 (AP-4), mu subunit A / location=Mono_scaffold00029:50645-51994(-) / protein_length=450 / sequence_SO=supercontig / SO=protein_coding / is_pseudo=false